MPKNLTQSLIGSLAQGLTGQAASGGGGSPPLAEDETVWGASAYLDGFTQGLPSNTAAGDGLTIVGKFRVTQLSSISYLARRNNASQGYVSVETDGDAAFRQEPVLGSPIVSTTVAQGVSTNDVVWVMFAASPTNATAYVNGSKVFDNSASESGDLRFPQRFFDNDMNVFGLVLFDNYIDPDSFESSFFDGSGNMTDAMKNGDSIDGHAPVFSFAGDATAANALAGTNGTVTDA